MQSVVSEHVRCYISSPGVHKLRVFAEDCKEHNSPMYGVMRLSKEYIRSCETCGG